MKRVLIIGAGIAGEMLVSEMVSRPELKKKYELVGFLDDDIQKNRVAELPVLGTIDSAQRVIDEYNIKEVIIAIPSASQETIQRIIDSFSEAEVTTKIVPPLYEIISGQFAFRQVRTIEPVDLLGREEVGFDLDLISPYYQDKTVFITGAGGSIGSEIFHQLFQLPVKRVIAFGHGENSIHNLTQKFSGDKRFVYIIGDVKDKTKIVAELKKYSPDLIFHAAAHKHVPLMEDYPDEAIKNNVLGTYNVATAAIEAGVKKFVLISTDKAVNPTSVMGASKRISERIILSLDRIQPNTRFALTRFGNVLGSRGSVIPIFQNQISQGGPLTVTHPEMTRFFMSIREAARLVIKSATIEQGKIFVLDMGKPVRIVDLAKNIIRLYGYTENEIEIKYTGLRPGEKMYEEVLTDNEKLAHSNFDKLFISFQSEILMEENEIHTMLTELLGAAEALQYERIRELIKKYVPEYKRISNKL